MTAPATLWTTGELPGQRFDPEPDDDVDDGPYCRVPRDLWGQGADWWQLATMTDVPTGSYL